LYSNAVKMDNHSDTSYKALKHSEADWPWGHLDNARWAGWVEV